MWKDSLTGVRLGAAEHERADNLRVASFGADLGLGWRCGLCDWIKDMWWVVLALGWWACRRGPSVRRES